MSIPLVTIRLSTLREGATRRPAGYFDRVVAMAIENDGVRIHIAEQVYRDFCLEFRGPDYKPHIPITGSSWWAILHAMIRPTSEEFGDLADRLPPNRRSQLDDYRIDHPVDWSDFPRWASAFHDAITERINNG